MNTNYYTNIFLLICMEYFFEKFSPLPKKKKNRSALYSTPLLHTCTHTQWDTCYEDDTSLSHRRRRCDNAIGLSELTPDT